jgi:hypothetical protein
LLKNGKGISQIVSHFLETELALSHTFKLSYTHAKTNTHILTDKESGTERKSSIQADEHREIERNGHKMVAVT